MSSDTRILVTGATGYTGGKLARFLVEKGYQVRVIVRNPEKVELIPETRVEVVQGDIRNASQLRPALEGIHTVYHIAAEFRRAGITDQEMWDSNVQGAKNMLEASSQAGVSRFVHCSSVGVHGGIENPPATETSPFRPNDFYHTTKLEAEKIVQSYIQAGGMEISIFRPAGIYGPGEMRFLKLFKSIKRGYFVMLGSGEVYYQMGYIDDILEGIYACGTLAAAVGETFILTGETACTLNELVTTIAKVLEAPKPKIKVPVKPVYAAGYVCEKMCEPFGLEPPLFRRRVDFFRLNRSFDVGKAKALLGYSPKVDLESGIEITGEWYAVNNFL